MEDPRLGSEGEADGTPETEVDTGQPGDRLLPVADQKAFLGRSFCTM